MPLIGITICRKLEDYRQAILHVGGEVRILDASMPVAQALAGVGGLLLTGGEDVAPSRYGESPHVTVVHVQDIPSQVHGAQAHSFPVPPHESYLLAHEVWLEKDALLSTLMRERLAEADTLEVNSRHHQAVKEVARGFLICATAPDGVIEAIEDPGMHFCLGVQWHPENFFRTGEFRALFEGFVEAAAALHPSL